MRNIRTRTKCIRVSSDKSSGVCRCYSDLQLRYLEKLDKDNDVKEVRLNVKLQDLDIEGTYSTDFVITLKDETTRIRECVLRKHLTKPLTIKRRTSAFRSPIPAVKTKASTRPNKLRYEAI